MTVRLLLAEVFCRYGRGAAACRFALLTLVYAQREGCCGTCWFGQGWWQGS